MMRTRRGRARLRTATATGIAALTLALTACSSPDGVPMPVPSVPPPTTTDPAATSTPSTTPAADGPVQPAGQPRVVASNLDLPWSLVRLSTGTTLVSERDTALVKEISDDGDVRRVGKIAGVVPGGEGGLLGLAVDPTDESWLYAYTTTARDNRIIRMPLTGTAGTYRLGDATTLLSGIPKAGNHNGGRIKFGPDGMLYATAGDAGDTSRSQDKDSLGGKILRLEPDGGIPTDNPFDSAVYSYGHRNPQGISWDSAGRMWASEFGQNTWDELNLISKGSNYGWPIVEGIGSDDRYSNPVKQWSTSEASPSGLLATHNTLFMAALRGERLWAIYPDTRQVDAEPWFTGDFGRLRDVIDGPDGTLWVLTNNTGRSPRDGDDKVLEVRLESLQEG